MFKVDNTLPFYRIFDTLRRNGFPLGIEEYKAFIELLTNLKIYEEGESFINEAELLQICRILWLKPEQVPFVFDSIFKKSYSEIVNQKGVERVPFQSLDETLQSNETKNKNEIGASHETTTQKEKYSESAIPNNDKYNSDQLFRIELGNARGEQQGFSNQKAAVKDRNFLFSDHYFPISKRDIFQLFTYLVEEKVKRQLSEIDVDTTLQAIARTGYFSKAYFLEQAESSNRLVILSDHKGSMIAFEKLTEMISDVAEEIFLNNDHKDHKFYFHNVVSKYIYLNRANTEYIATEDFINSVRTKRNMLMIISDAGAARGNNSNARVKATIRMLMRLQTATTKIVWMNPIPDNRWQGTSAARISKFVSMYYIDKQGLQHAVDALRGKSLKAIR